MSGQRGEMSLAALLVASVLMIVVLGASLDDARALHPVAGDGNRRTAARTTPARPSTA